MRWVLIGVLALVALLIALPLGFYALSYRGDVAYETLEARYGLEDSSFIEIGDVRAHYTEQGPAEGRTLLLLHGFSASLHTWEPWVERLESRYRVVRLDLPGHGLTRADASYQPSTEAYADFVAAFVEALSLPPVVIVGSSMGGHVAWTFARRHPEKTAALALVAAAGWPEEEGEGGDMFALLRDPFWGPLFMKVDTTDFTRRGLQASFVDQSLVTEDMVARYVTLSRAPGRREILRRLLTERELYSLATPEILAEIEAPTLVLHGDRDALVPVESGRAFARHIPNARLIEYQNVGHIPQEEIADRTVDDLVSFLDGALPSDPTAGIGQPLGIDPGRDGRPLAPANQGARAPLEGVY